MPWAGGQRLDLAQAARANCGSWQLSIPTPLGQSPVFAASTVPSPAGASAYVLFNISNLPGGQLAINHVVWYVKGITSAPSGEALQPGTVEGTLYSLSTVPEPYYGAVSF